MQGHAYRFSTCVEQLQLWIVWQRLAATTAMGHEARYRGLEDALHVHRNIHDDSGCPKYRQKLSQTSSPASRENHTRGCVHRRSNRTPDRSFSRPAIQRQQLRHKHFFRHVHTRSAVSHNIFQHAKVEHTDSHPDRMRESSFDSLIPEIGRLILRAATYGPD